MKNIQLHEQNIQLQHLFHVIILQYLLFQYPLSYILWNLLSFHVLPFQFLKYTKQNIFFLIEFFCCVFFEIWLLHFNRSLFKTRSIHDQSMTEGPLASAILYREMNEFPLRFFKRFEEISFHLFVFSNKTFPDFLVVG